MQRPRNVSALLSGGICLVVAIAIVASQVPVGGGRLAIGCLLALPWAGSGVVVLGGWRPGAWLAASISLFSLGVTCWIISESGGGHGRWAAGLLFAAKDGSFSWAGVGIVAMGFALVFAVALALSLAAALQRPRSALRRDGP